LALELAKTPAPQTQGGAIDAIAAGLIDRLLGHKSPTAGHTASGPLGATGSAIQTIAATLVHTTLEPIARERPIQLVAGAAAIGALLVWSRPWHWFDRGAVARLVVPMIVARVLATKPPP
jgi:hypothetical protein